MDQLAAKPRLAGGASQLQRFRRPLTLGLLAGCALVAFYLGLITLAQGWSHATQQIADDVGFVGAIAIGFGIQVGLFTYIRGLRLHSHAGGVATSTGTSTVAMLACCAHHVSDLLPVIGLSGAAIFLNAYRTPLLWLGVVMNPAGIAYLLHQLERQQHMLHHREVR